MVNMCPDPGVADFKRQDIFNKLWRNIPEQYLNLIFATESKSLIASSFSILFVI